MRAPAAQRLAIQEKTSGQFAAGGPYSWTAGSSSGEHDTLSNVNAFNGCRTDMHENRPFVAQTVLGKVGRPQQQDRTDNERMPTIYALSPWPSPRTFRKRVQVIKKAKALFGGHVVIAHRQPVGSRGN